MFNSRSKRCGQGSHHIYNKLTGRFVYTEGTVLCWRPDTVADFVAAARRKEPPEQQTRINIFKQILMLIGVWLIWPLVDVETSLLVCTCFIKEYTCALNFKVEILFEFRKKKTRVTPSVRSQKTRSRATACRPVCRNFVPSQLKGLNNEFLFISLKLSSYIVSFEFT